MGAGGPPHARLAKLREDYALSIHGVGLSIGSPRPLDREHLKRLKALVERYQPESFSEHLAWSSHGEVYYNDLLPLPYTEETLARVSEHVDEVQSTLGRQMLLENPSTYVLFAESTIPEVEFLRAIAERTGCGLLLDVNNVFVSAKNHGTDALAYLERFPLERVKEIHLGGHDEQTDDTGAPLLIDAHGTPVVEPVWALYAHVIARTGPIADIDRMGQRRARRGRSCARKPSAPRRSSRVPRARRRPEMFASTQASFAAALLDAGKPVPEGVTSHTGNQPARRFAVYRNNVVASLVKALGARFPVVSRIVGEEFFNAMARVFVDGASTALAAPDDLWRRFPRLHRGFRARGGAALSRRRGATGGRAHTRLSRGGCRACRSEPVAQHCSGERSAACVSCCILRPRSCARATRS